MSITVAIARIPTPIFNTSEIPFQKIPLKKDKQGRLMEMETVALTGTKFQCIRQVSETILEVSTTEYPSSTPLYVDSRFLQISATDIPERPRILPSSETILRFLDSCLGMRYFWGGNWETGIPEMLDLYPALKNAPAEDQDDAICRGFDCSGFLYRATNGFTPRNTSGLVKLGTELEIQHLPIEQIEQSLQPLDMLVWRGHVVFVRKQTSTVIESRINGGVVISNFAERYVQILNIVKQENKTLYIRRWHPDFLPTT